MAKTKEKKLNSNSKERILGSGTKEGKAVIRKEIQRQDKMLDKIYGEEKVKTWDDGKKHEVYQNLIAREQAAMLDEMKKKKTAAVKTPAKKSNVKKAVKKTAKKAAPAKAKRK